MTRPKDLIDELRRSRVSQGIAQFDLAEASGYDRGTFARYESGYRVPVQFQLLCDWAEVLGHDIVLKAKE